MPFSHSHTHPTQVLPPSAQQLEINPIRGGASHWAIEGLVEFIGFGSNQDKMNKYEND